MWKNSDVSTKTPYGQCIFTSAICSEHIIASKCDNQTNYDDITISVTTTEENITIINTRCDTIYTSTHRVYITHEDAHK